MIMKRESAEIPTTPRKVAVLLNCNAQRVAPSLVDLVSKTLPDAQIYLTHNTSEGRAAVEDAVHSGCDVLCSGGGDGTFVHILNKLTELSPVDLPAIVALRLGSGNSIADVCGASAPTADGLRADLLRASSNADATPLDLLDVRGTLTHFAGVGLDTKFNEDLQYVVKQRVGRGRIGKIFHGVPGLFVTALFRTIPRLIFEEWPRVRITNIGANAYRLDRDGQRKGEALPAGTVLYEGRVLIAIASTVPTLGRGLNFFPFVDRMSRQFQLRVSNAGLLRSIVNLRRIFAGTYYNPSVLWDFEASAVHFEFSKPSRLQLGGEIQGPVREFDVRMSPRSVPILRH